MDSSANAHTEFTGEILHRIQQRNITVGVIGLGYVGLPLAVEFARKGLQVIGIDIDERKIESLRRGANYIQDVSDAHAREVVESGAFCPTADFSRCGECDVIFICVPTPFTVNKDPDISHIVDSAKEVSKFLKRGQIIILKSTTFPGTTERHVQPILEQAGMKVGSDYFLAFSPERIDPGNKTWHTGNTPIVVGGITKACTELACEVNRIIIERVIPASSPSVAEMEKLLENIFRSVNIALVNELAQLCDRIGVNIWEVVDAAATKPFGFMPFYPGPGIGGHCILIDPYYLSWMAREHDFVTNFITLAAEVNESMPFYVRSMIVHAIAERPIALKKAKVLLLGMAFKRDVDDLRHSPALKVAELLIADGITNISYYDPYIPITRIGDRTEYSLPEISPDVVKSYDIVVITTDHSTFDYNMIAANSGIVIDTRNACRNIADRRNIVLLGDGK